MRSLPSPPKLSVWRFGGEGAAAEAGFSGVPFLLFFLVSGVAGLTAGAFTTEDGGVISGRKGPIAQSAADPVAR